ncbi:MAG: hypothetical protein EOO10_20570 [Chitinophagaceae bacterium]|nr:MAG: hypothetical protein EOO10_20570 [Chitinophagaceae bacterium]
MAQIIKIGTLRFVELYEDNDKEKKLSFKTYLKAFSLLQQLEVPFAVIGSVNGMSPLLQKQEGFSLPVFVFDERENRLLKLANHKSELMQILGWIDDCWREYSEEMFLPRNASTNAQYKQFVQKIKNLPEIDPGYWIDFAFKELDIRYEV